MARQPDMAEERALAALETLLMSRTVGWVTPTEAEAVLREASPPVPFLGLKTVIQSKARDRLVFKGGRVTRGRASAPHEDNDTQKSDVKPKVNPIDYIEMDNKEQLRLPEHAFSKVKYVIFTSHNSDCHMKFAEEKHTAKIAVGHTPAVSRQRSCGGLEQDVDRAEPASLDVPARALLPQHKAAPSHQTNDSAYEQPWLPRSTQPPNESTQENSIAAHDPDAGSSIDRQCPRERTSDASVPAYDNTSSGNKAIIGQCIAALEGLVCQAPGGKMLLSRAGTLLYRNEPAYRELVTDWGGLACFVHAHAENRLFLSECNAAVWLLCPSGSTSCPPSPPPQAACEASDSLVGQCMVALEKIVSEMLDDKMLLSEAFTRLLAEDATCSRIIRGEGDILRFIHAHQGRVYVHSTTGADTWLACHRQRPDAALHARSDFKGCSGYYHVAFRRC